MRRSFCTCKAFVVPTDSVVHSDASGFYPLLVASQASIEHVRDAMIKSVYLTSQGVTSESILEESKAVDLARDHARDAAQHWAKVLQYSDEDVAFWSPLLVSNALVAGLSIFVARWVSVGGDRAGLSQYVNFTAVLAIAFTLWSGLKLFAACQARSRARAGRTTIDVPSIPVPTNVNKDYWSRDHLNSLPIIRFWPNIVLESILETQTMPLIP